MMEESERLRAQAAFFLLAGDEADLRRNLAVAAGLRRSIQRLCGYAYKLEQSKLIDMEDVRKYSAVCDRLFRIRIQLQNAFDGDDMNRVAPTNFREWSDVLKWAQAAYLSLPERKVFIAKIVNNGSYLWQMALQHFAYGRRMEHISSLIFCEHRGYFFALIAPEELRRMIGFPARRPPLVDVRAVNWEILPFDSEHLKSIRAAVRAISTAGQSGISTPSYDRLLFFEEMNNPKPVALVRGLGAFKRYFGVQFSERLVALENTHKGNAIYIMFDDWKELSKLSKQELLASKNEGRSFIRIVHSDGWKTRCEQTLRTLYGRNSTPQEQS